MSKELLFFINQSRKVRPCLICWLLFTLNMELLILLIVQYSNNKAISGMTPLHYAALQENEDYALILVNSGANPEQKDFSGETPLESSSQEFRRKVFRLWYIYFKRK